jgi:energy-coupling factor transport system permease protein
MISNPLALAGLAVAVVGAGFGARVGRQLMVAALVALPLGLGVAAVNALVARDGLTVIVRLGDLPLLGQTDVTLEATVYGAILGLRAVTLILCGTLYTLAVDPDDVLRLFRRASFRSALTATLATRMVPVLIRDSRRLADAQRCRPGRPPSRLALVRAGSSGMLDRALDVAAALEVRGYGAARRPPRMLRPYSRHDLAFFAAAAAIVGVAVAGRYFGLASFTAYPGLSIAAGAPALAVAIALPVCALAPFADRRGIGS